MIESAIDKANHYGWLYSDKSVSKVVPVGLGRKIEIFKKLHRDLLPFDPLRTEAAKLVEQVERLKDDRHWMAHGYVIPWDTTANSWHFVKHEFLEDGSIKDLHRTFRRSDLIALTSDLCQLSFRFSSYGLALAEQVEKYRPNNKGS